MVTCRSMSARWRSALVCAVALLVAMPAAGQTPWWRASEIQRELTLTAEQVRAIEGIYRDSLPVRRRLRLSCDRADAALEFVLRRGDGPELARPIVERAIRAHQQRNIARTMMLVRMLGILTPAQRALLDALTLARPRG